MDKNGLKNIIVVAAFFMVFALGFRFGKQNAIQDTVNDTITTVIYDTISCVQPVAKDSVVIRYEEVFVPIEEVHTYTDTMHLNIVDSVSLSIPITQKHYTDSTYEAWVSGYKPTLDSIKVFQRTEYINTFSKPKAKRWGIGVQGGAGANHRGFTPYIGVGISYNFITF